MKAEQTETKQRTYCYLFEERFVAKVLDGSKTQTIRKRPKNPPKPGDIAQLEQWEGVAYRSKRRVLKREVITKVMNVTIHREGVDLPDMSFARAEIHPALQAAFDALLDEFAINDGFEDWADLVDYFESKGWLPFSGILVTWA